MLYLLLPVTFENGLLFLSFLDASLFRRPDVKEILVGYELTVCVYNCNRGKEVSVVDWMHNDAHNSEPFSLRDDVLVDVSFLLVWD